MAQLKREMTDSLLLLLLLFWQFPSYARRQVYDAYPSLLAEQTAYATAAATLDLKHYRLNNYAIENEKVRYHLTYGVM